MTHTICPICKCPLERVGSSAACKNGHSFDYAKEGYLNLLPSSAKHSQNPGDNKDMVMARKLFLDGGHYAPLAQELADIINDRYPLSPITLIDAGVGTGYYLNKIIAARTAQAENGPRACAHASAYNNIGGNISNNMSNDGDKCKTGEACDGRDVFLGADISKIAVRYAAKLNPEAECCVASVYDLPYGDGIADVVTCVFSPHALSEYRRVLKPDGMLIVASPCENHLIELRRALYENVREVESPLKTDGFSPVSERELTYKFTLNSSDSISALLMMTPYAYRAPAAKKAELQATRKLTLTADFKISVLKPLAPQC